MKARTIEMMDTNNASSPIISFDGNLVRKSSSAYREVRIDKNITIDVTDEKRATEFDKINMSNHNFFLNLGKPIVSSLPPGTVKAAAKTTVAISVATSIHDDAVSFIHLSPSMRKLLCSLVNRSCATSPSMFLALMYDRGTIFSTA